MMLDKLTIFSYTKGMSRLDDALRKAIDIDERSRYAICKRAKIDQAQMSRYMSGDRCLSHEAMERVADALGLDIQLVKQKAAQDGKTVGKSKNKR